MGTDSDRVFSLIRDRFNALDRRMNRQDEMLEQISDRVGQLETERAGDDREARAAERDKVDRRRSREFKLGSICIIAGGGMDWVLHRLAGG